MAIPGEQAAVAVDVGGTKIAAGIVTAEGEVRSRARLDTPNGSGDELTKAVLTAVGGLGAAAEGLPVGVAAAGLVDRSGAVRYSPNLAWVDCPLQETLAGRLDRQVVVENDANAAAWAEYRFGAASSARVGAVMITVGTGIGGGLVVDDRLARGANGLGAEFGHMIVAEGGRRCPCGNHGCWEAMASGTAIGRVAREWRAKGLVPTDSPLARAGGMTGAVVGSAAREGDETATAVLAECGQWLGVGLASLVNALDPETIVIGGGAASLGDLLIGPATASCHERVMGRAHRRLPLIREAVLGEDSGLIGAALLALEA